MNGSRFLPAAMLIAVGVAGLLQQLGYIALPWRFVWPIVIILIGFALLFRRGPRRLRMVGPRRGWPYR